MACQYCVDFTYKDSDDNDHIVYMPCFIHRPIIEEENENAKDSRV